MVHHRKQVSPAWLLSLAFLLLAALIAHVVGDITEAQSGNLPCDEAEAQAIDRMLMCPVCPAETIDQAQVELARQMQEKVREMCAAGATREEILSFFVDRYGPEVLAAPPKSGFNLIAWILPAVAALAGLAAAGLVLRSMVARRLGGPTTDQQAAGQVQGVPEADLGPYLAVVDQEIAQPQSRAGRRARPSLDQSVRQARGESDSGLGGARGVQAGDPESDG